MTDEELDKLVERLETMGDGKYSVNNAITALEAAQAIAGLKKALKDAERAAIEEKVEEVGPGDAAYNRACEDIAAAIRALREKKDD